MADLRPVTFRKYQHIDFIRKHKPPVRLGIHKTLITPLLKVCFRLCWRVCTSPNWRAMWTVQTKTHLKPRPARPARKLFFYPVNQTNIWTNIVFEDSVDQSPGVDDGNRWAAARLSLLNWCETKREKPQLIHHSNYRQSDGPIKYRRLN